jgi:hypothetical protein
MDTFAECRQDLLTAADQQDLTNKIIDVIGISRRF